MSEPDNRRVISKAEAMSCCRSAMTKVRGLMCRNLQYRIELNDAGDEAAANEAATRIAESLAAVVVRIGINEVTTGGVITLKRFAIIKISTGLLVSSFAAQASIGAESLVRIVQVNEQLGIARVAETVLDQPAIAAAETFVDQASSINRLAPIVGEVAPVAVRAASHATAEFNVILSVLDIVRSLNDYARPSENAREQEEEQRDCCAAVEAALKTVWEKAPKAFHEKSMKTADDVKRAYGRRASRRN